jgi:hypothetical protein
MVAGESITSMRWNTAGTMLAVGGSEGGAFKVFKILWRAKSQTVSTDGMKEGDMTTGNEPGSRVRVTFEMLRGVSPARIRGIEWSESGLWSGFVSGNGTLRKFDFI